MMKAGSYKCKCELWIEESGRMSLLFVCDPNKNITCPKGSACGKECTMTSDIHCAKEFNLDE